MKWNKQNYILNLHPAIPMPPYKLIHKYNVLPSAGQAESLVFSPAHMKEQGWVGELTCLNNPFGLLMTIFFLLQSEMCISTLLLLVRKKQVSNRKLKCTRGSNQRPFALNRDSRSTNLFRGLFWKHIFLLYFQSFVTTNVWFWFSAKNNKQQSEDHVFVYSLIQILNQIFADLFSVRAAT